MIKYLIHEGFIQSKNDKELHFIKGKRLISLYKVNPKECRIITNDKDLKGININDFINLYPKYNGKYNIGKSINEK